jgi:sugar O-acyltransferase (sialic acid O-acetyltransferase NeuD family)
LVIVGAGGFAREVRMVARDITRAGDRPEAYEFVGYVVSDPAAPGPHDSGDEIIGDLGWLAAHGDSWDVLALGIGYAAPRLKVADELAAVWGPDRWPALVHPSAVVDHDSCTLGHGAFVAPLAVMTVGVSLGPFAAVNYACTVGHESVVGRGSTLLPGSNVGGGVVIGDGVMVGSGAQVLQYLEIGDRVRIGAGSLVTKSVPAGKTAVGMPARWSRG